MAGNRQERSSVTQGIEVDPGRECARSTTILGLFLMKAVRLLLVANSLGAWVAVTQKVCKANLRTAIPLDPVLDEHVDLFRNHLIASSLRRDNTLYRLACFSAISVEWSLHMPTIYPFRQAGILIL